MFQKMIVGVDGSEPNKQVVEAAARLSASTGATLILVHVLELIPGRVAPHSEPAKEAKEVLHSAETAAVLQANRFQPKLRLSLFPLHMHNEEARLGPPSRRRTGMAPPEERLATIPVYTASGI